VSAFDLIAVARPPTETGLQQRKRSRADWWSGGDRHFGNGTPSVAFKTRTAALSSRDGYVLDGISLMLLANELPAKYHLVIVYIA